MRVCCSAVLSLIALAVIFIQICDGFTITRADKDEKASAETKTLKPEKKFKTGIAKNKLLPTISIESKKKNKLKISELKPCISKAFCEVNSITGEPTYETNKEFFKILSRLNKFIDKKGSGSVEDDTEYEESSEESSYERVPHRAGPYPPYRRGKSVINVQLHLNGTEKNFTVGGNDKNVTKVLSPAEIEKRAFIGKKAQELTAVEDLAALIKISAEIGQALRSPRRCRSLFKKCDLSYDQIIRIFTKTQTVVKSEAVATPAPLPPTSSSKPRITTTTTTTSIKTTQPPSTTSSVLSQVLALDEEDENLSQGGKRNQKSRTDFSEEDPDYYAAESENQPVKTYSLFDPPPSQQEQEQPENDAEREEAIVDEAFKKFEKVFPSQSRRHQKTKANKPQKTSSEENEESGENASYERHTKENKEYAHRTSAENDEQPAEEVEVEMEVPPKKSSSSSSKQKNKVSSPVAEEENDSDAEISSSEIDKRPKPAVSSGEVEGDDDVASSEETSGEDNEEQSVPATDNEGYQFVRPSPYTDEPEPPKKSSKGKRKGEKKKKVADDENSSEEEVRPDDEKYLPPPGSQFYNALQHVNGGKGADAIPSSTYDKLKQSKRKPGHQGARPEHSGGYTGYAPESHYGGGGPHQDDPQQPSFFQSIVGWFRGDKPKGGSNEYSGEKQPSYYHSPSHHRHHHRDHDADAVRKRKRSKSTKSRRGDESSEEEYEQEAVAPQRRKKKPSPSLERQRPNRPKLSGPPPPLVIVPPGEQPEHPTSRPVRTRQSSKKNAQKHQSEEESRETSSEEVEGRKRKPAAQPQRDQPAVYRPPENDKAFSGIFSSAYEIDKQMEREKQQHKKENHNLLLNTFDTISSSFSTSADKIPDWSEEDNSQNKIKVASLVSNPTSGRYRVVKKKPTVVPTTVEAVADQKSSEEEEEEEEEEEKKKK